MVILPALFNSSLSRLIMRYAVLRDTSNSSATSVAVKNRLFAGMAVLWSAIISSFPAAYSNGVYPCDIIIILLFAENPGGQTVLIYNLIIGFRLKTPSRRTISYAHSDHVFSGCRCAAILLWASSYHGTLSADPV